MREGCVCSGRVVLSRLELLTPTLSVWCSNQLSYRTVTELCAARELRRGSCIGYRQSASTRTQAQEACRYRTGTGPCGSRPAVSERGTGQTAGYQHGDISRKEVFQPHLPVRLPCYDLAPITSFALGRSSRSRTSGAPGFHGLTGGVYKARERIHRAMADARLLANPASWSRVADSSPN